jgi:hypothetical protein
MTLGVALNLDLTGCLDRPNPRLHDAMNRRGHLLVKPAPQLNRKPYKIPTPKRLRSDAGPDGSHRL